MVDLFVSLKRNAQFLWTGRLEQGRYGRYIWGLTKIYHQLDHALSRFRRSTGMQCVRGCGVCCESPHVEATVPEMIPLALNAWHTGQAEQWLARFERGETGERCVFYKPHQLYEGTGRCSVYIWRPLLCRLFGFAARRNKRGLPEMVTCDKIKKHFPEAFQKACQCIKEHGRAVLMSAYVTRVANLGAPVDPGTYPINDALAKAIIHVGWQRQLRSQNQRKGVYE